MEKQNAANIKIEIKVDDEIASGKFVNYSNISSSAEEFILDFVFIHPTPPPGFGKLLSRILCTPAHAKRFANALSHNIKKYEEKFGEIKVVNQQPNEGSIQ